MKYMLFHKAKDPENRSKKYCICGGHSHKDVKKNLNHHSTKMRLKYRRARKYSKILTEL